MLDADVAAIVCGGDLIAAVGFAEQRAPIDELERVRPGSEGSKLEVAGVGAWPAAAAALEHQPGGTFVVARAHPLTQAETVLLDAMARVASIAMRMLSFVARERAAREELERLGREQVAMHRVATLVASAGSADEAFSAVAEEAAQLWNADIARVLRYEPDGSTTVVGGWGDGEEHLAVGTRYALAGEDLAASVFRSGRPARTVRFIGPAGSVADAFRRAGARVGSGSPIVVEGHMWGVVISARPRAGPISPDTERRISAFTELVATAIANAEARVALRHVAHKQAALRRVATLVARGEPAGALFGAVAEEVGRGIPAADVTLVGRYHPAGVVEVVGGWSRDGNESVVGERITLGGNDVLTLVVERNEPARVDRVTADDTPGTALEHRWARSSAAAPIGVEGRLWGVMTVGSLRPHGLPDGIENQLADFTDLVATAIGNAQAREELGMLADEQAALRRVAILIARGEPPAAAFAAVAEELGRLFGAEATGVNRYEPGGVVTSVGSWNSVGDPTRPGTRLALGGHNVTTLVFETGRVARVDRYAPDDAGVAAFARGSGLRSAVGAPISVEGRLWGSLQVAMSREASLPARTEERLTAFAELTASAISNAQAREELTAIAEEQAALRRVATLVAEAARPPTLFAAVADEVGRLLRADRAFLARYDGHNVVTIVGAWSCAGDVVPIGWQWPIEDPGISFAVRETGRPARIDWDDVGAGIPPAAVTKFGIRSAVAAPIMVQGGLWGLVGVGSTSDEPAPPGTEARLAGFTDLVATAIANAHAQAELTASRGRIVATEDETRRRIERDLHDGTQQRLVSLILQLRAAREMVPTELAELAAGLDEVAAGLASATDELREYVRGIHPAILTKGGLEAALKALTRRSTLPVQLNVRAQRRLPEPLEAVAYFIVSEALTNAAKHSNAAAVVVDVEENDHVLRISVQDDGIGGADFGGGSGLVGLKDRVEALGGRISLESPPGAGTSVNAELPTDDDGRGLQAVSRQWFGSGRPHHRREARSGDGPDSSGGPT